LLKGRRAVSRLAPLPTSRRELLTSLALGATGAPLAARGVIGLRAIAFDAFVVFNSAAITRRAAEIVDHNADALVASASMKLFGYTWLYTSAGRYVGFESLAREAFGSAARASSAGLTERQIDYIVEGYSTLEPWPDVSPALDRLRSRGIRVALLSNLPKAVLEASLRAQRIERQFDHVLSTDQVRRFKPAPEAYAMATSAFGFGRQNIGFAASAGWDAAGATWFGFPTAWVNRSRALPETAHARPAIASEGIEGVLTLAGA
jgi:2-haloacid dehalogenase